EPRSAVFTDLSPTREERTPWSARDRARADRLALGDVDVELLRPAEGRVIPDVHEQVVDGGSGDEGGLRQLRLRHGTGRTGRLHLAMALEVAAARCRAVVVEEIQQAVAVGIVRREQRRRV